MRILVFNRSRLEKPSAQAINVVHTCAALARQGIPVTLHADVGRTSRDKLLEAYGTSPAPQLSLKNMGWRWHSIALRMVAGGLMGGSSEEPTIVFLREVRPYVSTLIEAARQHNYRIAFEAHNAAGKMAAEAAYRSAPAMPAQPETPAAAGAAKDAQADPERSAPPPCNLPTNGAGISARERAELEKSILAEVDALVAPQRLTLEAVRDLVRPGVPTRVVPNGTLVAPSITPPERDIDILYLGSLSAWKGVDTLVAAMPRLYPYKLTVVGGREDRDRQILRHKAVQLGCAERIEFIPPVPPSEVWKLYARAKLGVVPLSAAYLEAREYTCPLKLLEMMAAGLPLVTSRLPSVQEFVKEGEDVLMARSDDPDDFSIMIRRLLEDPELAARLTASAKAKAGAMTYEKRARSLLEVFELALKNKP